MREYYQENEYLSPQQDSNSLIKGVGAIAMSLAAWGIFHSVSVATLRKAESVALKTLRNTEKLKSAGMQALRAEANANPNIGLWKLIQKSSVVEETSGILSRLGRFARRVDLHEQAIDDFIKRYDSPLKRVQEYRRLPQEEQLRLRRSLGVKYLKAAAVEAPIFYIGEQLYTRIQEEDASTNVFLRKTDTPSWYNIPGHILNFAKWLPAYMVTDVVGRAAMFSGGVAREALAGRTDNLLQGDTGNLIIKALEKAPGLIRRTKATVHAIGDAARYAFREGGGESGVGIFAIRDPRRAARIRLNKDPVGEILNRARYFAEGLRRNISRSDVFKHQPISTIHKQYLIRKGDIRKSTLYKIGASVEARFQQIGKALESDLYKIATQPAKLGILPRMLGLVPARLSHLKEADKSLYESVYNDLIQISKRYAREFSGKDQKHLRQSLYRIIFAGDRKKGDHLNILLGEHIYFDPFRKRIIDLNEVSPGNILRTALKTARKALSFGRRFDTLGLFQLHLFEHKAPAVSVTSARQLIPESTLRPEFKHLGGVIEFAGVRQMGERARRAEVGSNILPGVGVFVKAPDRKGDVLYTLQLNPQTQTYEYVQTTEAVLARLPEFAHSKLRNILAARAGILQPPESSKKQFRNTMWGNFRRWMAEHLDLFSGSGENPSALDYIRAYVGAGNMKLLFNRNSLVRRYGFDLGALTKDQQTRNQLEKFLERADAALYTINRKNTAILQSPIFKELLRPVKSLPSSDERLLQEWSTIGHENILSDARSALQAVEALFEFGDEAILRRTPEFSTIGRLYRQLTSETATLDDIYNPTGERISDKMRRFLINYRLTSIAEYAPNELKYQQANTLGSRVLETIRQSTTTTEVDEVFTEMLFVSARMRRETQGRTIGFIKKQKDYEDRLRSLLDVFKEAEEAGTLDRFSQTVSPFTTYNIPETYKEDIYREANKIFDNTPYLVVSKEPTYVFDVVQDYIYSTFGHALDFMGLGFDRSKYTQLLPSPSNLKNNVSYLFLKRALFFSGVQLAYNAVDTFTDVNPIFDGTVLDEGLTVALADQVVNARLLAAKLYDITGVTDAARYLEGLMPKSTSTIPGAAVGFLMGGIPGAIAGATLNRYVQTQTNIGPLSALAILPPLAPFVADLTKSYEELRDIYSGKVDVPYRKGRFWSLGTTPIEGGRISMYAPSWYARLKSQYKATPALYGSKVEEFIFKDLPFFDFSLGDIIAPQYLEQKHYEDRPYVVPGTPFSEVPIVGPILGATVGRLYNLLHPFASNELMHVEEATQELTAYAPTGDGFYSTGGFGTLYAGAPALGIEKREELIGTRIPGTAGEYFRQPVQTPYDLKPFLSEQLYRGLTEPAGIFGFSISSILWEEDAPFTDIPVFAQSGEMDSFRRDYWDMNLGDTFMLSEGFRRLFPKPRIDYEKVNPVRNTMPDWLPEKFQYGDPYCLTPDTLVEVNGSLKQADQVEPGDLIRTVKGRFFPVKRVAVREVDEDIYVIKLKGIPWEIKATNEHPFYINGKWVFAEDLREGDYVQYPLTRAKILPNYRHRRPQKHMPPYTFRITASVARMFALMLQHIPPRKNNAVKLHTEDTYELRQLLKRHLKLKTRDGIYHSTWLTRIVNDLWHNGLPTSFFGLTLSEFIQFLEPLSYIEDGHLVIELPTNKLAYQVWSILVDHHFMPTIEDKKVNLYGGDGRALAKLMGMRYQGIRATPEDIEESMYHTVDSYRVPQFLNIKIEYIRKEHYKGPVYGYEVDIDDSFCVAGALTHNTKVPFGEAVLPGKGYEALNDISLTFPVEADQLGFSSYEQALQMIGLMPEPEEGKLDSIVKQSVQATLAAYNERIKTDALVYDVSSNIEGRVDVVIPGPGGVIPIEIKPTDTETLSRLTQPTYQDLVEMNAYLNMLNSDSGVVLYVDREHPSTVVPFQVRFNPELYNRAMASLETARSLASSYLAQGYGSPEQGYSFLNRAEILLNVAPFSQEFKDTWKIVKEQYSKGLLSEEEQAMFKQLKRQKRNMMFKWEMYPRRFHINDLLTPDTRYNNYSSNEYIKAAAKYTLPERILGSVWESFTHLKSPLHSKFFGLYSPEEQYERFVLYGREFKSWNPAEVYENWLEPYSRGLISVTDPAQGALSYGLGGWIMGGPVLASIATPIGIMYGIGHGLYRKMTGTVYVPDSFEERAELAEYFDRIKFYQAHLNYLATRDPRYLDKMQETTLGWTIMGLADEGMRRESREKQNAVFMGLGTDLGFGSPWRGIVGFREELFNYIFNGRFVKGTDSVGYFLHREAEVTSIMDRMRFLVTHGSKKYELTEKELADIAFVIKNKYDQNFIFVNKGVQRLKDIKHIIRHERAHEKFQMALDNLFEKYQHEFKDYDDLVNKLYFAMPETVRQSLVEYLKESGYPTAGKNKLLTLHEAVAYAAAPTDAKRYGNYRNQRHVDRLMQLLYGRDYKQIKELQDLATEFGNAYQRTTISPQLIVLKQHEHQHLVNQFYALKNQNKPITETSKLNNIHNFVSVPYKPDQRNLQMILDDAVDIVIDPMLRKRLVNQVGGEGVFTHNKDTIYKYIQQSKDIIDKRPVVLPEMKLITESQETTRMRFVDLEELTVSDSILREEVRHSMTPLKQQLGPDRGFGSPWRGIDHNAALEAFQFDGDDESSFAQKLGKAVRGLPYWDRPFFFSFMATPFEDRERILKKVDPQMKMALQMAWKRSSDISNDDINLINYFQNYYMPPFTSQPFHPLVPMEDVQMVTVENAGFDSHDFGLGWRAQARRLENSPIDVQPIDINAESPKLPDTTTDAATLKDIIYTVLQPFGISPEHVTISIRTLPDDTQNETQLTLQVNRVHTDIQTLNLLEMLTN